MPTSTHFSRFAVNAQFHPSSFIDSLMQLHLQIFTHSEPKSANSKRLGFAYTVTSAVLGQCWPTATTSQNIWHHSFRCPSHNILTVDHLIRLIQSLQITWMISGTSQWNAL